MSALRHQAVVERAHREVDQRVGQPALTVAIIVLARALGQKLQRRLQRRAPDLVEDALNEDDAIVSGGEGQASRLDSLLLLFDKTLGIARVPSMSACVA